MNIFSSVQDIVFQMNRLLTTLSQYHEQCNTLMSETNVFPIELDLPQTTFQYADTPLTTSAYHDEEDEEDEEPLVIAEEALPDTKPDEDPLKDFFDEEELPKQLVNLNLLGD